MAKRVSLASQIAEVERELAMRPAVYKRLVDNRQMRQAEAELHIERMQSVLTTLTWLQANEDAIKAGKETNRALWDALRMIREAVEAHAPAGSLPAREHTGPHPSEEAEALIAAIVAIATGKTEPQA